MSNGSLGNLNVNVGMQLDPLSCVMMLVVTGVGFLIHVYSIGYMAHEGGYYRFFGYLNLFMFSMLVLVLADNYLMMFVGWEGVGLCSYLLIGFYFLRKSASDAGKKAFIVNRIGDAGFLLGVMLMVVTFGTLDFHSITDAARSGQFPVGSGVITTICILLFIGATGKSAQIPLYIWLPDAMEGPTPVSALIHAATMVTAGVYMVARSNALFALSPKALALGGRDRRGNGHLGGVNRPGAERYQARAGLFDGQPVGLHVSGLRRGRIRGGRLSPDDARLLQSPIVPCFRQRHPRAIGRARYAQNGRTQEQDSHYLLDHGGSGTGDLRNSAPRGLRQQGRDSVAILCRTLRPHAALGHWVDHRRA